MLNINYPKQQVFSNKIKFPEQTAKQIWLSIPQNIKVSFFSTFVIGMLAHIYIFTNFILNHDGLAALDIYPETLYHAGVSQGRFLLPFVAAFNGNVALPSVLGTISIIIASLITCLIVSCLNIKGYLHAVLIGATFILFPASATYFAYIYVSDVFFISIFLAILGAYIANRFPFGVFVGALLICFSVGIYQSQICFSAGLFIMILIFDILRNKNSVKSIFIKAVKLFFSLCLGVVLYFIVLKVFLATSNIELTSYKGINEMGKISIDRIPSLVYNAYKQFYLFYYSSDFAMNDFFKKIQLYIIIIGIIMLIIIAYIKKIYKNKSAAILLFVLVGFFPLSVNAIYVIAPNMSIYLAVLYQLSLPIILCIAAADMLSDSCLSLTLQSNKKGHQKTKQTGIQLITINACIIISWVQIILISLVCYNNWIIINEGYIKSQIHLGYVKHFSSTLAQRIENFPGYKTETMKLRIGEIIFPNINIYPDLDKSKIPGLLAADQMINSYTYNEFLNAYVTTSLRVNNYLTFSPTAQGTDFINAHKNEIDSMPLYPAEGGIKIINDVMVIKLGEID